MSGFCAVPRMLVCRVRVLADGENAVLVDQRAEIVIDEQTDSTPHGRCGKPSKKWKNGTREWSVTACGNHRDVVRLLQRAEASIAKPVRRQAITSE